MNHNFLCMDCKFDAEGVVTQKIEKFVYKDLKKEVYQAYYT